ncbi:hypothetical protein N7530_004740 [Penicillium desertorum]|uniref:Uncharacterized protein n=1 Tax=Penicillium desertorum TaxID=1303715 RepID=A0A9W9WYU5_9EURO|nr:hypothetical protein N7530_004740 [Penicillium desertorum]
MDSPFTFAACIHSTDQSYLAVNGVPLGCAHMQFEVFALVHYTNGFWIHDGPEEPRDLHSAVAAKLKVFIQDFMRAVRSHRQEWQITAADRTRRTLKLSATQLLTLDVHGPEDWLSRISQN